MGDTKKVTETKPKVNKLGLTPEQVEERRQEHLRRVAGPAKVGGRK